VQQWDCNGTGAQIFHVSPVGGGYVKIVNANSKKALDVTDLRTTDGALIQQWGYGGGANQQFEIFDAGNSQFGIRARHSGKALDVKDFSQSSGARVQQWTWAGTANQRWTLQKAPTGYFAEQIGPIFQSERCSTCHALGSKSMLVGQHHGLIAASDITETATPRGTQMRCGSGCHVSIASSVPGETFDETEWMVPSFDMGIDWTGKSVSDICVTVKTHLPTAAAQEKHFFEDARIAWAVHSGVLPNGTQKPKAPPGNFAAFKVLMEAWIQDGSPCP